MLVIFKWSYFKTIVNVKRNKELNIYLKNHFNLTKKSIWQSYKLFHGIPPIFSDKKKTCHTGKLP